MSPALSNDDDPMRTNLTINHMATVETVMAIHQATLAKLLANGFGPLVVAFLEDAAATYQQLADRLRDTSGL